MHLRNGITKFQADGWYELKDVTKIGVQADVKEHLEVGEYDTGLCVKLEYCYTLPEAQKAQVGVFTILAIGGSVSSHHEVLITEPEFSAVEMSAYLSENAVMWIIDSSGVSENPVLQFKRAVIERS